MFGLPYRLLQGCVALLALLLSAFGVSRPADGRGPELDASPSARTVIVAAANLADPVSEAATSSPAPASAPAGGASPLPAARPAASACPRLLLGSARGARAP